MKKGEKRFKVTERIIAMTPEDIGKVFDELARQVGDGSRFTDNER